MASWVDTLGMSSAWLSRPTADTPIPRARRAVISGSTTAGSAPPNTISKTTSAAAMPTPTDRPRPTRSELVMAGPPSETCTSGPSADWAALMRFLASAEVT